MAVHIHVEFLISELAIQHRNIVLDILTIRSPKLIPIFGLRDAGNMANIGCEELRVAEHSVVKVVVVDLMRHKLKLP